jgi:hypothetical protein
MAGGVRAGVGLLLEKSSRYTPHGANGTAAFKAEGVPECGVWCV